MDKPIPIALTYDDVLLVPKYSRVNSRKQVNTVTRLSRRITLNIPIVASNMDTVCENATAVEMARAGGIGILHRFCSIKEQCAMISKVKRAQSLFIEHPRTLLPDATAADAREGLQWGGGINSLMVIDSLTNKKLLGIITAKDVNFAPKGTRVTDLMTPLNKMKVSHDPHITLEAARNMMIQARASNLPVVTNDGILLGLVTASDVLKLTRNKVASLDQKGRLLVGAAVGVKPDDLPRARALVEAGADVLVVDIAHGHSAICVDMVKLLKKDPVTSRVDIIAGNIATAEGARALIDAGADGLKVGVGPGSICITRLVAGAGVPQLTAVMEIGRVARPAGVPLIADGGIKTSGDIVKALIAGADTVMLGNMLSGTEEAPGRVLVKDGKKVKIIRGMAGYGANISKAERQSDAFLDMTPEGVEGCVPFKGPLAPIVSQLVGGVRSGLSYCGAASIEEARQNASFVRVTPSGIRESASHDIAKL